MSQSPVSRAEALLAAGHADQAVALVTGAADAGDVDALMRLATWRLIGSPLPRDLPAARLLLRRAAAIGHVDAALMEVALTANGSGAPADWPGAMKLLRAAALTDPVAAAQLALVDAMALDAAGNPRELPRGKPLATAPRILHFTALLTPAECAHVASVGSALLEPARVFDPATGRLIPHPVRTSDGGTIGPTGEDLVIQAINRRIAAISSTSVAQGEPLVVLRYTPGQEYRLHHDAIPGADNQRIVTVLIYLNGGFTGGETIFPEPDVTITPRGGDAVLFDNLRDDGSADPRARHAGLPVGQGAKWLATRWIRHEALNPWAAG
jgi:prolyl 4-hydroxylase